VVAFQDGSLRGKQQASPAGNLNAGDDDDDASDDADDVAGALINDISRARVLCQCMLSTQLNPTHASQ
jgi:hypothetical protein